MDKKRLKELLAVESKYQILKEAHDHYKEAAAAANHYILQHELNKLNYAKQLNKLREFISNRQDSLDPTTVRLIVDYIDSLEKERKDNGYCNSQTYYRSL